MAKHLVDLDEAALVAAQAQLRTSTMKDTVNEALRLAGSAQRGRVSDALDRLAKRSVARDEAWRSPT